MTRGPLRLPIPPPCELPDRPSAVTDLVLFLIRHFRHRPMLTILVGQDRGVVANPAGSARLSGQPTPAFAEEHLLTARDRVRIDERHRADVPQRTTSWSRLH